MITRQRLDPRHTLATWLLPVVPPMVSAATGAALISHLPSEGARRAMLLACLAMFGLSLVLSLLTIALLWFRLIFGEPTPPALVPTLWIVLGPLGQSVTAAGLLGAQAGGALHAPYAAALEAFGVVYGLPIWGFAMLWLAIAASITIGAARRHLPFSLSWWSFTFPVGTVVTGTSVLATGTGAAPFTWIACALYAFLLGAWAVAFANTARIAWSGAAFLPPPARPGADPPRARPPAEPLSAPA
jgi:tellurite resistance protein TehA-like permease